MNKLAMTTSTNNFFILLVRIERVVHRLDVGPVDRVDVGGEVFHRVDEIAFEAVQRLDGEPDAGLLGDFGQFAVALGGMGALGVGGGVAGEIAEFLVVGAADVLDAGLVPAFDDPLQMIDSGAAVGFVRADEAASLIGADGDGAGGEAVVFQSLADPGMFMVQLRAILRAAQHGSVRLLVPMPQELADAATTEAADEGVSRAEWIRAAG